MKKAMMINIDSIEQYYTITEDGRVWSKIKSRWLKPQHNNYGYVFYCLLGIGEKPTWVFIHTLVAIKYIGAPPSEKHEVDHIDGNRANNHYTNLQWVTHSQNQLKAYAMGRVPYWLGRPKPAEFFSADVRAKMSDAKKKRICYTLGGVETVFESIDEAAVGLGTYRKRVYVGIKHGKPFKGGFFTEIKEMYQE